MDVGANYPQHLSITAALHSLGWRGLLIEADPELAELLRVHRPDDVVVQVAAAAGPGELSFFRVPGTGLGTLDEDEAQAARRRGFDVERVVVPTDSLDAILDAQQVDQVHFMSIDVEGAEAVVLQGLSFERHRPWVLCVEAVLPGTDTASHEEWEPAILSKGYACVAFDGVNRWYVADEHAELGPAVAVPFNVIDAGEHGWVLADQDRLRRRADRADVRRAWQRELILHDIGGEVPRAEYERQILELRTALAEVEGSRAWQLTHRATRLAKGVLFRGRQAVSRLPAPLARSLVRRRHLKHVTVNMGHLTDPAYLGAPPPDVVGWITPEGLPSRTHRRLPVAAAQCVRCCRRPGLARRGSLRHRRPAGSTHRQPRRRGRSRHGGPAAAAPPRRPPPRPALGRWRPRAVRRQVPADTGLRQPRHRPLRQGGTGRRPRGPR